MGPGACPKQAFDSTWPEGEALPVPGLAEGQVRVCLDLVPARGGGPPPPRTSSAPQGPLGLWQDHGCWAQRQAWHTAGGLYGTAPDSDCPAAAPSSGLSPGLRPGSQGPRLPGTGQGTMSLGRVLESRAEGGGGGAHCTQTDALNHFTPICSSSEDTRGSAVSFRFPSCANMHRRTSLNSVDASSLKTNCLTGQALCVPDILATQGSRLW